MTICHFAWKRAKKIDHFWAAHYTENRKFGKGEDMDINQLLKGVDCSCGRHHSCDIRYVYVERNAMARLEEICGDYGRILLVADENTYAAAGEKTEAWLTGKVTGRQIFSGKTVLIPNEEAIEAVSRKVEAADMILGVGSGVIQDLCKYVSFRSGIPYVIVATAPSMDGYASSGAAMITDGMKVTYSATMPMAIVADTEVLKDAPMEMIQAGYGDIVGKYSSLNDWKLGHAVHGEYFCKEIYDLTYDMLQKTLPLAKALLNREEESVRILMEALVVVGIAMSFAGNSRPASGSEHHLSHYFEITGIVDGTPYLSHGIDVAFSTVITCAIREKILSSGFPRRQFRMEEDTYRREMHRVYRSVAEGCMTLQEKLGTYRADRVTVYREKEETLRKILSEVPSSADIRRILAGIGLEESQFRKTYSEEKIRDAVRYAKDLKDRYTVLWMYYDLFGLEEV